MQEGIESIGKFVVSRGEAAELFEAVEESLDEISRLVAMPVDLAWRIPVATRRNDGLSTGRLDGLNQSIAVIALVGDERFRRWQARIEQFCAGMVAHLSFGQQHGERLAVPVADNMQLGVQTTLGAPDTAGNIPFLSRLAAVRCAFRCVASIMMRSGLGPSAARLAKIRSKTPSLLHLMNRL